MKLALLGAIALASVALAACSTLPNGDYAIFGQDIGAKDSALVSKYNADLQNFKAALPNACAQAKSGQGFTIFTSFKPSTVAQLNGIAQDIVTACNGLEVATAPVAAAQ